MAGLISRVFGGSAAPKSMHVKEVNIYPIKSCKGMRAATAACGGTGACIREPVDNGTGTGGPRAAPARMP